MLMLLGVLHDLIVPNNLAADLILQQGRFGSVADSELAPTTIASPRLLGIKVLDRVIAHLGPGRGGRASVEEDAWHFILD